MIIRIITNASIRMEMNCLDSDISAVSFLLLFFCYGIHSICTRYNVKCEDMPLLLFYKFQ